MSLDVYLEFAPANNSGSDIFIRENGQTREISQAEWSERFPDSEPVVFKLEPNEGYWSNITHNLGKMAKAAGIYEHLWRPEEIDITTAGQLVEPLTAGLATLRAEPDRFRVLNPSNGWGNYEGLVQFVADYLAACQDNPTATIRVSR